MSIARGSLRILVSGMIAAVPHQGGATWAVLQYILGFKRLTHDVCFVEPVSAKAIRPSGARLADSDQAAYFAAVVRQFHLESRAAIFDGDSHDTFGMTHDELLGFAGTADVLINLSGTLGDPELLSRIPTRVFLDLDPAFNQLWHASEGVDLGFARHNRFVTIGMNIGRPGCPVPTCGLPWLTSPQPIVLQEWPVCDPSPIEETAAFTTIANWRAYGSITHDGVFYGQKAHSLRPLMALPALTRARLVLALAIHPGETRDIEALAANGWELADPLVVAGDPESYRAFVQSSRAELGIAKSGYVASGCGWFSDRSLCYLASGRPVLAQDTGFSQWLPVGEGILTFSTLEEAVAGVEAIGSDYPRHARAARTIAERYFDSDRVLTALLEQVGGQP